MKNPRSVSSETRTDTSNRQDIIFFYLHLRFLFQNDLSHWLDDKVGETNNFQTWNYWISLILEENELDTYISREVPVLEGDEAKILTQEELGQDQEDHC